MSTINILGRCTEFTSKAAFICTLCTLMKKIYLIDEYVIKSNIYFQEEKIKSGVMLYQHNIYLFFVHMKYLTPAEFDLVFQIAYHQT